MLYFQVQPSHFRRLKSSRPLDFPVKNRRNLLHVKVPKPRSTSTGKKILLNEWQRQELHRILLAWPTGSRIGCRAINNRPTLANCDYNGIRVEERAIVRHLFKTESNMNAKRQEKQCNVAVRTRAASPEAQVLSQGLMQRRGSKLEWSIIWLLVIEIGISYGWNIILEEILGAVQPLN